MENKKTESPFSEQQICVTCGFCCDSTLFVHAYLKPGEKGTLPLEMEKTYIKIKDDEFFKQPCSYFDEKCTIYNQKKAHICGAFRCQLLKNFESGKITQQASMDLVKQTKEMREDLLVTYHQLTGDSEKMAFREILKALHEKQKELEKLGITSLEWDLLTVKCNILESLLIKHFKSEENFQSMIAKEEY
jgi:hypothetical protein